jgi:hypothetical protein
MFSWDEVGEGWKIGGLLSTHSGDGRGSMGVRRVFEDFLDVIGERFSGLGSGDRGDSDKEQESFDEFRFHGMRMLFVV